MVIVREVALEDLDALWDLIGQANAGMTSLNIDKEQLADRIERSHFAFRRLTERAEGAPYVFVMQDLVTGRLVGTSCIFSKIGGFEPFYAYRIVEEKHYCELLKQTQEIKSLHLIKTHNGPTEIGSLFLRPEYRGHGCGKLLSMSRFAYIHAHPKRFASQTIAEMRGFLDPNGVSPFWEAIGSHFFKIDFPRADSLSMIDKQFIEDLMPKYPIYLELLPKDARPLAQRGYALAALKQSDKALADFELALKLDPKETSALIGRAELRRMGKKWAEAITDYDAAIGLDPADFRALMGRAAARYGQGEIEKALEDYSATMQSHPEEPQPFNDYAWMLATAVKDSVRDGAKAVDLAKQACKLTGYKNAAFIDTLAAAYAEKGEWDEALKWQQEAVKLSADQPEDVRKELEERIPLYKEKKAYREAVK